MHRRLAGYACFLLLGLALSYLERLVPLDLAIPGVKLGLGNLVTVLLLFQNDPKGAFLVNTCRVLLSGLLFGNLFGCLYGLCGGTLALLAMWGSKKAPQVGVIGSSIMGGIFHNIGQLTVAGIVLGTVSVWAYLPFLLTAGTITGCLVGIGAGLMLPRIQAITQRIRD